MKYTGNRTGVAIAMLFISVLTMSFSGESKPEIPATLPAEGEITSSVERNGDIGVNFYLSNLSSQQIEVKYTVDNSSNVDLKDMGAGGIIQMEPNSRVLIMQAIIAGPGDWYSGDLHYTWQP